MLISAIISGCTTNKPITPYLPEPTVDEQDPAPTASESQFEIRAAFVHHQEGIAHEGPLQHLMQSTLVGFNVQSLAAEDWRKDGAGFDLVVLDESLAQLEGAELKALADDIRAYASGGGHVYVPHAFARVFPEDLLGINGIAAIATDSLAFDYPEVDYNYGALQDVWSEFAGTYAQYNGLNPEFHIHHEFGVIPGTAEPIVELDGVAMMTANRIGSGSVIWSNQFMPNQQFITRFDLIAEEEQKYFHFGYASANYFFLQELAAYTAKEKYGYALSKAYGPYGRPGLAWQNHYEEAYSYKLKDMITWTDLLQEHQQIPTFSLVRSSYNGGQWHTSIAWHKNEGAAGAPEYAGESLVSHFTAGVRMEKAEDYIFFDRYPGYNSLMTKLEEPHRAFISVVDWDGDGVLDLLSGDVEGQVWLLKQKAGSPGHLFEQPEQIGSMKTGSFAAPAAADVNGDGKWDVIVGDGDGTLSLFENTGTDGSPKFAGRQPMKLADGTALKVTGPAAPNAVDWNGDGVLDLLVGDGEGYVHLYAGEIADGRTVWQHQGKLSAEDSEVKAASYAAPHAADWNEDGVLDLLVGSSDGTIQLYLGEAGGGLRDTGVLEGQFYNFYGDKKLIPGKNVVPVVVDWDGDGKQDLLTGHLEYAIPRPIDSELFPFREDVIKNLKYAQEKHIPLIPHMFLSTNFTDAQEKREIQLHKDAFHHFDLTWDNDMGVNHHTWRINQDALSTFRNQAASGIWWNFGFNPPNVSTAPRDGVEFLMVVPFDASKHAEMSDVNGDSTPFILFSPAANILNFSRAWEAMARFNMPLTYFEHIEHGMQKGSDIYNKHITQIGKINEFRQQHNYTFMTEEQMARSLLNTFYGQVKVESGENELTLTPDMSQVPWQVKEYADTLGVRIELGERYKDMKIDTNSMFYYKDENAYYIGLDQAAKVQFVTESAMDERIYIQKTNAPVRLETSEKQLKITLDTYGMQEVTLHSPVPLEFKDAKLDYVASGDNTYTFVHYGEPVTVTVKLD